MSLSLVYAKKVRLPSQSANVWQSLNMAAAFEAAGADVCCFPGSCGYSGKGGNSAVLHEALQGLGLTGLPRGWTVLPGGNKGLYGLAFRAAVTLAALSKPGSILYARDIFEADYVRLLTKRLKRACFYEAHEILHLMHKAADNPRWSETLRRERAVFASLTGLICTTTAIGEQAREALGYQGPLLIAPNGFNPAFFHPLPLFTAEHPWPGADARFTAVYAGNFHPGKGVEELLEAFSLLPERFCLRIVGGNPKQAFDSLRGKAWELGLRSRVEFIGAVPQHKVRDACAGAHTFVIPQQSAFYFSPLKLYEAMALGLPTICTPLQVFAGQIDSGAVLGAPGTEPAALAKALNELAGQPDMAERLREKGIAEAADKTWLARASRIIDFSRSLVAGVSKRL